MSSPDRDGLLAAYRAERGPTRVEARRLWARLQADTTASRGVRQFRSVAPRRGRIVAIAAIVLAAAAVAVLAWAPSGRRVGERAPSEPSLAAHGAQGEPGGTAGEASSVPPTRRAVPSEADAPAPTDLGGTGPDREGDPGSAPSEVAPDAAGPRAPSRSRPATRKPAPAPAEPPAAVDSLAEETSLLRRARAALIEGRPGDAIEVLRDYDRRFPSARLSEEADAVRTMARCRKAPEDPRALADAFVARYPGSLFRKQVDAACASDETG